MNVIPCSNADAPNTVDCCHGSSCPSTKQNSYREMFDSRRRMVMLRIADDLPSIPDSMLIVGSFKCPFCMEGTVKWQFNTGIVNAECSDYKGRCISMYQEQVSIPPKP